MEIYSRDEENEIPSWIMASREKADRVLSLFDSIPGKRLLYSVRDCYYYIYIQRDSTDIQHYYVAFNNSPLEPVGDTVVIRKRIPQPAVDMEIARLESKSRLSRSERKKLIKWKEIRSSLDDAFNPDIYWSGLVTRIIDSRHSIADRIPLYYVMKDETGARYGELRLEDLLDPLLLNNPLFTYLYWHWLSWPY